MDLLKLDSNCAGDAGDRKSTSRCRFSLGSRVISQFCKKQALLDYCTLDSLLQPGCMCGSPGHMCEPDLGASVAAVQTGQ
jgi:hypothetical protein